ncbi:hypothetical protein V1504DRAFT_465377 [Lipomyces starkeyi]
MLSLSGLTMTSMFSIVQRDEVQQILAEIACEQLDRPYHPPIPYTTVAFDLDSMDDDRVRFEFRFSKDEIYEIMPHLRLDEIQWSQCCRPDPLMAFCIVLRRLAYPIRFGDLANIFGMSPSWLCCGVQGRH